MIYEIIDYRTGFFLADTGIRHSIPVTTIKRKHQGDSRKNDYHFASLKTSQKIRNFNRESRINFK